MQTAERIALVEEIAKGLAGTSRRIASGREGAGIGDIRWAKEKIEAAGLQEACMDAVIMLNATLKSYQQGNDNAASANASEAAERFAALISEQGRAMIAAAVLAPIAPVVPEPRKPAKTTAHTGGCFPGFGIYVDQRG